jgi:hypothetical protein
MLMLESRPWTDHVSIFLSGVVSGGASVKAWISKIKPWLGRIADAMPAPEANFSWREKWAYNVMAGFRTGGK